MVPNINTVSIIGKMNVDDPDVFVVTDNDNIVYYVPSDPMNTDFQLIQVWISEGNTPSES